MGGNAQDGCGARQRSTHLQPGLAEGVFLNRVHRAAVPDEKRRQAVFCFGKKLFQVIQGLVERHLIISSTTIIPQSYFIFSEFAVNSGNADDFPGYATIGLPKPRSKFFNKDAKMGKKKNRQTSFNPNQPGMANLERSIEQAHELLEAGRAEDAIELLEPLVKRYPRDSYLFSILGFAHARNGDLWECAELYRKSLSLERDPAVEGSLAFVYMDLGLQCLALELLRKLARRPEPQPISEQLHTFISMIEQDVQNLAEELRLSASQTEQGLRFMEEAQIYLHNGEYPQSIQIGRKAIKILGDFPPPRNNLALALCFSGHLQEAIETSLQTLEKFPDNMLALSNLVRFYTLSGQRDAARSIWERLRLLDPNSLNVKLGLLEAAEYMEQDQVVYELLKSLDPDELTLRQKLALAIAEANLGKRSARKRLVELEESMPAAAEMLKALMAGKKGIGLAERFSYIHIPDLLPHDQFDILMRIMQRAEENPTPQVRKDLERFVERYPQVILAGEKMLFETTNPRMGISFLTALGVPAAYAVLRDFGLSQVGDDNLRMQALLALQKAEQIGVGEKLQVWQEGRWSDVTLVSYEIREAERPYSAQVNNLIERGTKALEKGRDKEAEQLLQRALELEPAAAEAYNNLGVIYARRDEDERARAAYQKAIEARPLHVMARCNLAVFLLGEDKLEAAREMLEPLVEVKAFTPAEIAFLSYMRARIAIEEKHYQEARNQLDLALQINPEFQLAQKLMQHLEMLENLATGWGNWQERAAARQSAARARQQKQITRQDAQLKDVFDLYSKDTLVAMGRIIALWGGWSALKKAPLQEFLAEQMQSPAVLENLVAGLSEQERQALRFALEQGGAYDWQAFDQAYGNDLDELAYWQYHEPASVMGRLRLRGLLAEATVDGKLLLIVPLEVRQPLAEALEAEAE